MAVRLAFALLLSALCLAAAPARAFDHQHAAWSALLERHVRWNAEGTATTVDYGGFARDRAALRAYLDALSAVARPEFDRWAKDQRTAFLLNAYNAYTVELILAAPPGIASIKDLGSLLRSPWKRRFFVLLGAERHLDDVEHGLLRGAADFAEPRIHFAVNCASIGCPALRPEAYAAARLDAQLDDQTRRFLRDRTRNRFDAASGSLRVSPIFDWYGEDFERAAGSLEAWLAGYAAELSEVAEARARIGRGAVEIDWSDYDWALNGAR
jgi:hypothetical protein